MGLLVFEVKIYFVFMIFLHIYYIYFIVTFNNKMACIFHININYSIYQYFMLIIAFFIYAYDSFF